jgi:hypothetical protein
MPPAQLQADLRAACPYVVVMTGFSFATQMGRLDLGTGQYDDAYNRYRSTSPTCSVRT